jgi:SAM-dependent methyltransferase
MRAARTPVVDDPHDFTALRRHIRLLRCPACAGSLVASHRQLACATCGTAFGEACGVIDLRLPRPDPGACEVDCAPPGATSLHEMIRAVLVRSPGASARRDHALEGAEHAWRIFLALRPGMRVLDLDCGHGARASSLAMHGADIVAVAFDRETAAICARRLGADTLRGEGRHLVIVASSACRLPLSEGCIDVVLLPVDLAPGPPAVRNPGSTSTQPGRGARCDARSLVAETHRVLKADGQAVLVAANRWAAQRWAVSATGLASRQEAMPGKRDARAGAASEAKPVSATVRLKSLSGYRRLLARAGMETATTLVLHRDRAGTLVDLRDARAGRSPSIRAGFKAWIKRSVLLAPEFAFVARRSRSGGTSLLQRIVDAVAGQRIVRYYVSRKDKLVAEIESGGRRVILRLCLTAAARRAEERAAATLTDLARSFPGGSWYPRLLAAGEREGLFFTAEEKLPGQPLLAYRARLPEERIFRMGAAALETLNPGLEARPPSLLDGSLYQELVATPLERVCRVIEADARHALQQLFDEQLRGIEIVTGIAHGDLSLNNVLVAADAAQAIIDWENSATVGLPVLDAIAFVRSVAMRRRGAEAPGPARRSMALGSLSMDEERFLSAAYARTRTPRSAHVALVYLHWVDAVSSLLDFSFMQRPEQIEFYVGSVARALPEIVRVARSNRRA